MRDISPTALAAELLREAKFDTEKAIVALSDRIRSEKELLDRAVTTAAREWVNLAAHTVRAHAHSSRPGRQDDGSALRRLVSAGFLDSYVLLGDLCLGDATRADVERFVSHHCETVEASKKRIRFARKLLASPKFTGDKHVRDVFSERDIKRLLGEDQ